MKFSFLFFSTLLAFSSLFAGKGEPKNYFQISTDEAYLLTEKPGELTELGNALKSQGLNGDIHALFIWKKDVVYRIVCREVKDSSFLNMRTNTKELIPVLESLFATDEKFESYAEEHHLADLVNANLGVTYFVPTYTSEGLALAIKKDLPRMPLILPILFENKLNGTSLLLTAGTISRYQRKKEGDGFSCGMSLYLRGGIAAGATRNSEEQYYRFLNKGTLRILMDFGFDQQSEVAVTERLAENSVSPPQQFHPIDSFGMFYSKADHCDYLRIDSRYKSDDRFFGGRYAEYEYDNYCYDQRHSRSLRIYNGCSFAIDFQEFGYLTTYKNLRLFKVEGPLEFLCELTPWQLYIPGIGYWIIDIREDNEGKYFEPNITEPIFLVNGYSIYEYANLKSGKN